jgi:hypothetical protein
MDTHELWSRILEYCEANTLAAESQGGSRRLDLWLEGLGDVERALVRDAVAQLIFERWLEGPIPSPQAGCIRQLRITPAGRQALQVHRDRDGSNVASVPEEVGRSSPGERSSSTEPMLVEIRRQGFRPEDCGIYRSGLLPAWWVRGGSGCYAVSEAHSDKDS